MLLARSRYLFIKQHRARFGDRMLAELRGVMDEAGHSPFWDALGGRFFGMTLPRGRRVQRHPRHPVHRRSDAQDADLRRRCLPKSARAVIGQPHPSGRAALKMLENEGFAGTATSTFSTAARRSPRAPTTIRTVREATAADGRRRDRRGRRSRCCWRTGRLAEFRRLLRHGRASPASEAGDRRRGARELLERRSRATRCIAVAR